MNQPKKIAVIGAGLAGISVAVQFIKRGCHVTVFDNGVNHSSRVAAGMINPIVFRRMTKGWRVDEFLPYLKQFYTELENEIGCSFFHSLQLRRMFSNEHERNLWLDKQSNPSYQAYLNLVDTADDDYRLAINNFGSGRLKEVYYIDPKIFLPSMHQYISENGNLLKGSFNYNQLDQTSYGGVHYDELIFCEGYLGLDNPWFGDLPLGQTKGETITIKSTNLPENESLNRKCFILPLGDNTFKVGSTYVWDTPALETTDEGKQALLEMIQFLTDEQIVVLEQEAGVRPTTRDRRPLIGTHPKHSNYHIFNGLGAKGYMLAPLLSEEFADYILHGEELLKEVSIDRIYHRR